MLANLALGALRVSSPQGPRRRFSLVESSQLLVLTTVLLVCRPALAQEAGAEIEVDDRVRVVTTAGDTVTGDVARTDEHGLMLALEDGGTRDFTYAEIEYLESRQLFNLGATIGSGVIITSLIVAGRVGDWETRITLPSFEKEEVQVFNTKSWIVFGVGVVGGTYLGYRIASTWKAVPLVDVQESSLLLGMRVRF